MIVAEDDCKETLKRFYCDQCELWIEYPGILYLGYDFNLKKHYIVCSCCRSRAYACFH